MLESFPVVIIIGTVLGFLAGLGVGGGTLLILWLTLVINTDQSIARSINLLFFIPCAIVSSVFRWKQGALDFKRILPAIFAGCIGAAIFSLISKQLDISLLKKLFGFLLLITGTRELLYRSKRKK
ncbi:MAG: TSUP family transporter [Oscillospiraceae bacterium]|nr:TSUP family transporter [Oscillospiraceae bacterium]